VYTYKLLEYIIDKILFKKKLPSLPDHLTPILEYEEAKMIRAKICPFCGKQYSKYSQFHRHLRGRCGPFFKEFIDEVIKDYKGFRKARKTIWTYSGTIYVINGVRVRKFSEAFAIYKGWANGGKEA